MVTFEVYQNDTGLSPEVKFVFGFEKFQDWARFVNSYEHEKAVEEFETLTDNREAVLWQRSSMKPEEILDNDTRTSDGGRRKKMYRKTSHNQNADADTVSQRR